MAGIMQKKMSRRFSIVVIAVLLISTTVYFSAFHSVKEAKACDYCIVDTIAVTPDAWWEAMENFDEDLDIRFKELETFLVEVLWQQGLLPVMMEAAKEFSAVAMQQSMMVGMFIDAESQLNAQRLLQELRAKTHKDYLPSVGMCEFGSLSKSLAATEIRSEIFPIMFSRLSQERQLGKGDTEATYGEGFDHANRVLQFARLFCNKKDRGGALEVFCRTSGFVDPAYVAAAKERINKDIDYFSLVEQPFNMKLDLTNQVILDTTVIPEIHNEDEEHLMALSANLFGHSTFTRIPPHLISNNPNGNEPLSDMQKLYIDTRSIVAKRSVAENSLYAIAALKVPSPLVNDHAGGIDDVVINSKKYIDQILKEFEIPATTNMLRIFGENPSYYAQMEVLTKKLYQNPDFYVNLYDTPANVERKTVALQAIKLMQKFDMLKSYLRGEATVSILLEVAVSDLQKEIEDQIQGMGEGG